MKIKVLSSTIFLFSIATYLSIACADKNIEKAQSPVVAQKSILPKNISTQSNETSDSSSIEEVDKLLTEININIESTEKAEEGIAEAKQRALEAKQRALEAKQRALEAKQRALEAKQQLMTIKEYRNKTESAVENLMEGLVISPSPKTGGD